MGGSYSGLEKWNPFWFGESEKGTFLRKFWWIKRGRWNDRQTGKPWDRWEKKCGRDAESQWRTQQRTVVKLGVYCEYRWLRGTEGSRGCPCQVPASPRMIIRRKAEARATVKPVAESLAPNVSGSGQWRDHAALGLRLWDLPSMAYWASQGAQW